MKFCVIGLGCFGYNVATTLASHDVEVLAIDNNESIIASIRDKVTHAICMRITDEDELRAIGIEEIDVIIVAMGENFAQSILVTALLKQRLNVSYVITRSMNQIHKEILTLVGADEVILPEQDAGTLLAERLSLPFKALFRVAHNYSVSEVKTPDMIIGRTPASLDLLRDYQITLLGKRMGNNIVQLDPNKPLSEDDLLIISGANNNLERFIEK